MATNHKSISHPPTDSRMVQSKSYTPSMPRSSWNYPTKSQRSNYHSPNARYLYVINTPIQTQRTISARKHPPPIVAQQQPILPRPYTQYGHFLSYLRRQSLARTRRKQQEEEGVSAHVETTITFNFNRQPSTQTFQSTSYPSLASVTTETSSMPTISMTAKRAGRSSSSSHRPRTTYRLKTCRPISPLIPTNFLDDPLFTSSSVLITPRNSMVDETTMSAAFQSSELYSNNYHVNDASGTTNRRKLRSTGVR